MSEDMKADCILTGGRIFLGLGEPLAEALAIRGNRVLAVGKASEIEALAGHETRRIDLAGRSAIPGINDGHQHMLLFGLEQSEVNLHPTQLSTMEQLLDRIGAKAREIPPGEWILGRRYDHFHLTPARHPTAAELDRVAPDNPVYITRTCGHMGVANSRALALAGVGPDTPDPKGGELGRDDAGQPNGLLMETAQELIKNALPPLSQERLVGALELAGDLFLARGITSVTDAGLGLRQHFDDYLAYRAAADSGRLKVRTYLALTGGPNGIERQAEAERLMTGQGDERLKIGPVKLFADGSAGGKTAAMTLPYTCACDNRGLFVYSDEELNHWAETYHRKGYQLAIHAIGDAAIDQSVTAVKRALAGAPRTNHRHRIEHCGFTRPDQIADMARLGMIPAPQPIFVYEFGELYVDILGEDRPAGAYPMRSWRDAGLKPVASTDTPVSDFDPMKNLYCMVTRKTDRGRVLGQDERLSMEEALAAMTEYGAHGSFSEKEKGRLTAGQLADVAVLDRDIFAVEPEMLLETQVDMTLLDGDVVYQRT